MTATEQHAAPGRTTVRPGYGVVFVVALIAGLMLGVSVMVVAPPLYNATPTVTGEMEELAAEFGVSIVWTDSTHPESPGPGSFDPETPNLIYVSSEMDEGATHHTVLHEAGHAMQHRMGVPYDECGAEDFARVMGSTYYSYEECR